jgi:hypothetical protein
MNELTKYGDRRMTVKEVAEGMPIEKTEIYEILMNLQDEIRIWSATNLDFVIGYIVEKIIETFDNPVSKAYLTATLCLKSLQAEINNPVLLRNFGELFPENKTADLHKETGYVYIARQTNDEKIYKIGVTKNINEREQSLSVGNVFLEI